MPAHSQRSIWQRLGAVAALLAVLGSARIASAADAPLETVPVGVFGIAPFVIASSEGPPHGILIDFFDHEIAPRMGVRFAWSPPTTVARLEQNLIRGTVLFTPILAHTSERDSANIRFAGTNYIRFEPCVALLPEHRLSAITSMDDLAGLTIGWVNNGAMPDFLHDAHIRFELLSSIDWERANLQKLKLGRIDAAFFSDVYTPRYFATENHQAVKILKLPAPGVNLFGAFSPFASPALAARYQKAAKEAFANGRWDQYLNKSLDPR
jgi:ABC-type amino acid transport substrate-binding protein